MIRASVIVPTKNGGEIYKKVLDKILLQKLDESYEIIIIDSGSKDNTVAYTKEKQKVYENLKIIEINPSEFGHGKTRNYGASLAQGEFLLFLTQDALPYDENWIFEMIKPFELSENIVGVFGKHLAYDECDVFEKHNLQIHFDNFGEGIIVYKMEDKERYDNDEGYRHLLCFYSDNASAMRKSIWMDIPYKDVNFAEDQLWAKTIIEQGYSKAYASNAIVYHSHNYSFKERLMRSYDDHKGLYEIYQYVPVKSIFLLPVYILKNIYHDVIYLKSCNIVLYDKIKWFGFSIGKNISKYIGAYFGPIGYRRNLDKYFSRESILRGK